MIGEKSACVSSNSATVVADCYRLSVRESHTKIIRQVDVVQRDIVAVDAKSSSEVIASSTSSERGVVDDVDCVLVEVHDIPCIPINLRRGTFEHSRASRVQHSYRDGTGTRYVNMFMICSWIDENCLRRCVIRQRVNSVADACEPSRLRDARLHHYSASGGLSARQGCRRYSEQEYSTESPDHLVD